MERRLWPVTAVLILSLLATLIAWRTVRDQVAQQAKDTFEREIQINANSIREGLWRYAYAVRTVAAVVDSRPESWERLGMELEWHQHLPGMQDLGYAEQTAAGTVVVRLVNSGQKAPRFPPGSDLAADPVSREAQRRSLASQQPEGCGPLDCKLFIPASKGFAFATFAAADLWADLLRTTQQSPIEMRWLKPGEKAPPQGDYTRLVTMTTWGLHWRFICTPRPAFENAVGFYRPWLLLAGGLAMTVIVTGLVYAQSSRRWRAQQLNVELARGIADRTAELEQTLVREQELSRLKGQFVSTVSHEFRTPLGIIVSSAGILDRYLDRLTPEQRREHLDNIQNSGKRMAGLMEGVLMFSRLEAEQFAFNPQPVDFPAFCKQIIAEVATATEQRCPIELSTDGTTSVRCDESLIRHILTNLLGNAVKYSPAGTPVSLRINSRADSVILRIEDQGIGIPAADRDRLGVAFYRGGNIAQAPGTGLGLFIVKRCVELHRGTLAFDSEENRGTVVTVTLPL